ncbi:MAG: helix-turn-helix transcriptional regulator [Flavobacteriaceae bacterium]
MNPQGNIPSLSTEVLLQLVQNIKSPLEAIMAVNNGVAEQLFGNTDEVARITLENSHKIALIIEQVVAQAQQVPTEEPLFFELYHNNPQIRQMCTGEVNPKKISMTDKKWLKEVEEVVFNEPQLNQLSLFALAFEVSVSERQLHRNIKKFLKLTPNKYVRILKLHKAKQLLEEYTYKTLSEVAYAVGFSDPHYFSKQFQNQYGVLPKELIPA